MLPAPRQRQQLGAALAIVRTRPKREDELAYRALDLAYFARTGSIERVAEQIHVSRPTLFRYLKRGVTGLARALTVR